VLSSAFGFGRYGEDAMTLRKFVIEREVPKIGALGGSEMRGAAGKSNEALRKLNGDVQWVHRITEVRRLIDPTTERTG
jgi:hypothetical protein